jgi:hypothetical protein
MNNQLTLPGIDISSHFVRGLGDAVASLEGCERTRLWLVEWLFLDMDSDEVNYPVRT